jgi:anti-anti-sigma regulatory factor
VVIDLSGVTHFDYRGVRPLMRRADVFRELGGDVRLAGLSAYLFAIFRSAGADNAFDYFATVEDAVASFNRSIFVQAR